MDRSIAVGATSGSFSAILIRLLSEALQSEPLLDCPVCPDLSGLDFERLDLFSVVIGVGTWLVRAGGCGFDPNFKS